MWTSNAKLTLHNNREDTNFLDIAVDSSSIFLSNFCLIVPLGAQKVAWMSMSGLRYLLGLTLEGDGAVQGGVTVAVFFSYYPIPLVSVPRKTICRGS